MNTAPDLVVDQGGNADGLRRTSDGLRRYTRRLYRCGDCGHETRTEGAPLEDDHRSCYMRRASARCGGFLRLVEED